MEKQTKKTDIADTHLLFKRSVESFCGGCCVALACKILHTRSFVVSDHVKCFIVFIYGLFK